MLRLVTENDCQMDSIAYSISVQKYTKPAGYPWTTLIVNSKLVSHCVGVCDNLQKII